MSPNQEDDGRKYWNQFLSQPGDQNQLRNSMIQSMRGAGQEHNNKVAPKLSLQDLLDKTDKERCLLILKQKPNYKEICEITLDPIHQVMYDDIISHKFTQQPRIINLILLYIKIGRNPELLISSICELIKKN